MFESFLPGEVGDVGFRGPTGRKGFAGLKGIVTLVHDDDSSIIERISI